MEFSPEIAESFNNLEIAIKALLQGQSYNVRQVYDDSPILLLETAFDSVGFALVFGKPEQAYTPAYEFFKRLYRENHSTWKELNLSFIVCRILDHSENDAYYTAIENDAYFCRKYVINFSNNPDTLVQNLLRLPFFPLHEDEAVNIMRPPAAQTLLQGMNISAQLARKIIVPQESAAKTIVEELLSQYEALPVPPESFNLVANRQSLPTQQTRLVTVEIEAFRAYREKQSFDVNADVVVFYGPNGLGKTSFFDALDFVCTGRIGRLCQRQISQSEFTQIAKNLNSPIDTGYVNIQVMRGDKVHSVERRINDWSYSLIDSDKNDRVKTLQLLTSANWETGKARIENLERLFRATHLFGQSDSELLRDFTKDSSISPDIVHRMLALDDYASGLRKILDVLAELDKRISVNKEQINILENNLITVKTKINELPKSLDKVEASKHLKDIAASLARDLKKHINIAIDDIEPKESTAREWRSIAESALNEALDKYHQLQNIESGFNNFSKHKLEYENIIKEITNFEEQLKKIEVEYNSQIESYQKCCGNIEHENAILEQANLSFQKISEFKHLHEVLFNSNKSLTQWKLELTRVTSEINTTTADLHPLLPVLEKLRYSTVELQSEIQIRAQRTKVLNEIQNGISLWKNNRAILHKLNISIKDVQTIINSLEVSVKELNNEIANKEQALEKLEREYKTQTVNRQELSRLLDEIENHVEDGICPTCGIDHKSKVTLIKRIHAQKEERPAHVELIEKLCNENREILRQYKESLDIQLSDIVLKNREAKELSTKVAVIKDSISAFELKVSEIGLPIDEQLSETILNVLVDEQTIQQSLQGNFLEQESELIRTNNNIKELEQKLEMQTTALERANYSILPLEQQIETLNSKIRHLGFSPEMTPDQIKVEIEKIESGKEKAESRLEELLPQLDKFKQSFKTKDELSANLTIRINNLRKDQERLQIEIQSYEENVAYVLNKDSFSLEIINEQMKLATKELEYLSELKKQCINFERTLDATQRSALLAELEDQVQMLSIRKQNYIGATAKMSTIKKWALGVKEALQDQSTSSIANLIVSFGPLSSLIQKRLRAVYGFGDIRLDVLKDEIFVEVDWGNEHLKPADYFSDSQKQILMLSIFLAGRLSQTWSGFAPILMDDPVTHFDDLNAFGFVELIRGLVSTSPGKRQFLISTCEYRLFELMQKKFTNIPGGAKFYKFEGIGQNGPVVKLVN
jgi:exonuclease SbcC